MDLLELLKLECETDIGRVTIGEFLKRLLIELWDEGEGFSSKRPFGNSGWQDRIYESIINVGAANNKQEADRLIIKAIQNLFKTG